MAAEFFFFDRLGRVDLADFGVLERDDFSLESPAAAAGAWLLRGVGARSIILALGGGWVVFFEFWHGRMS